jgi:hypothetical protein
MRMNLRLTKLCYASHGENAAALPEPWQVQKQPGRQLSEIVENNSLMLMRLSRLDRSFMIRLHNKVYRNRL